MIHPSDFAGNVLDPQLVITLVVSMMLSNRAALQLGSRVFEVMTGGLLGVAIYSDNLIHVLSIYAMRVRRNIFENGETASEYV